MKDEYLILKRAEDGCIAAIQQAENMIYMNRLILHGIKKRLLRVPKPNVKARPVAKRSPKDKD